MSGIVGIFNRNGALVERRDLELMMAARPELGPDGQVIRIQGQAGLAHQHFWITPEEWGEDQPLENGDYLLSCDARLDNRSRLSRLLGLDPEMAAGNSDAALILLSYRKWGVNCLTHLLGDFAFILWDAEERLFFMARDGLGARELCYYVDEQVCVAASEVSQIPAHKRIRPVLNENKVAAFLTFLWDKPEETYYENIHFLPPAHGMVVSEEHVSMWRYWDVDPEAKIRYKDDQEYADHYLDLLAEAVRCRLRTVGPVGISLSGGLDSTSLAVLAAPMLPQMAASQDRLKSFSYAFDELKSCDERQYSQLVVDSFNIDASFLRCDDKWPLKNLFQWPVSRGFVLADPYAWLPFTVMEAAEKSGVRLLLAGYYGDVLFAGGQYWALDMMRRGRFGLLSQTILDNRATINWRGELWDSGLRQLAPQKIVRGYRRLRPRSLEANTYGIHPDLLARSDANERLLREDGRAKFSAPGQWHRYRTLTLSIFSQGLAATRYQYNGHGMELAQPYYDRRLVEFVMAVPAEELGRPDYDRRLHRQAMRGLLPEAVRKRRHFTDFSPLLLKGLLDKEKETVRRLMADPLVVQRKYISGDWLRRQIEQDLDLTGESMRLWFALCLELWLQKYWN